MLTSRKIVWSVLAFALALAATVWAATYLPSYQDCIANYGNYKDGSEATDGFLNVRVAVAAVARCEGYALDQNGATIAAISTVAIAVLTLFLWIVGSGQLSQLSAQVELARGEFLSTHRPKIVLREAFCGSVLEGEPISVLFHIANVGETPAVVARSYVRVEIVNKEQPRPLFHVSVEQYDDLGRLVLPPGAAHLDHPSGDMPKWNSELFRKEVVTRFTSTGEPPVKSISQRAAIHIVGVILYVNQKGEIPRRTGFRRELDPARQRFYRIPEEPDLDYED